MIVIEADSSDLRIDNNKEENDKNDVCDVAEILPDGKNGRFFVGKNGFDDKKIVDEAVHGVNTRASEVNNRTD